MSLQILFCTTECAPFSKVGGLADVSQALPAALKALGAEVTVITPLYGAINRNDLPKPLKQIAQGTVSLGAYRERSFSVLAALVSGITIWFVDSNEYFARNGIYEDEQGFAFWDNGERYIFFQKVILEMVRQHEFQILHVNDHHTSLLPVYLKKERHTTPPKTVLTIHNIGYQGSYSPDILNITGLGWADFYPGGPLEFHGQTNFLKGGILYADRVTTVSPGYAGELLASQEISFGLDGVLRSLDTPLTGILNGVDYRIWSPESDDIIPANYSAEDLAGKQVNRKKLLKRTGLPALPDHAVIGIISRLVDSKGFELLIPLEEELMELPLQWVILGSGEQRFEDMFRGWSQRYPKKVAYHQGYDAALSHLIEAGADMFLMPSKYEACGLNQIYSLRYGTIPIVRQTGGLGDTVQAWNGECGTGFNFQFYSSFALLQAINQALRVFRDKQAWQTLMRNAMAQDFSWEKSARAYLDIYRDLMK
ncbi:MAG: glycogen synthase [Candidatus Marinimicrobia bacterium]|nr:glycogen synthase [Candidatus Neomarinimicrobiota bacterium]MCF7840432.1 glycogen synthase [Candidatus Neomarinimicrobiota bacterium]MCF7903083.1 glycogen synthase [Candidatus Neomarinimicrobiota bacterium]